MKPHIETLTDDAGRKLTWVERSSEGAAKVNLFPDAALIARNARELEEEEAARRAEDIDTLAQIIRDVQAEPETPAGGGL